MKRIALIPLSVLLTVLSLSCCSADSDTGGSDRPLAPTGLRAEIAGVTSIRLNWTATDPSSEGCLIERSFDAGAWSLIATVGSGTESYLDRSLADEGTYAYRLCNFRGSDRSDYATVECAFTKKLIAPTDLQASMTTEGLMLTWSDRCEGEEGYLVTRQRNDGEVENWKFLKADSESVVDAEAEYGLYEYAVMAYSGTLRSEAATVSYERYAAPQVALGKVETSWYMASAAIDLRNDGGEACRTGICWSETGTPTLEDHVYEYSGEVCTSEPSFGNAVGLDYGRSYNLRGWASNREGTSYTSTVTVQLAAAPEPLVPQWEEVTGYGFPDEVRLYRTSTSITGGNVNAWYAVADLSTGAVELRTTKASKLTRPTDFITQSMADEEVYVVVNGGYFAPNGDSYSYVRDRGTQQASNIRAVTRTRSYTITRGALGVDASQRPSLWWIYDDAGTTLAYDRPLPVVDGCQALTPSRTNPTQAVVWSDNYSGVGGAPVLVRDGRLCFDYLKTAQSTYKSNYEMLQSDIFADGLRAPRTAIGYRPDGRMVLMVVDGRNAGGSRGVTLDELARLMMGVGCDNVLNLDGGGSSMICVTNDGRLLNSPSDGSQRAVLTFVGFVKKR